MTIIISLRPASDPRISKGASSARNTGTTVEAAPTARPRITRPTTMTPNVGANDAGQRADEEQHRHQDDRLAPTPRVGEPTAGDRADGGAEEQASS